MIYINQVRVITAILRELDAQEPGTYVSQAQMNAIIQAADLIVRAMLNLPKEEN